MFHRDTYHVMNRALAADSNWTNIAKTSDFYKGSSAPGHARVAAIPLDETFCKTFCAHWLETLHASTSRRGPRRWVDDEASVFRNMAVKLQDVVGSPACRATSSSAHQFEMNTKSFWAVKLRTFCSIRFVAEIRCASISARH